MKVRVTHWRGGTLPEGLIEGDQEMSPKEIIALYSSGYNVMLDHNEQVGNILWVEAKGKKFTLG